MRGTRTMFAALAVAAVTLAACHKQPAPPPPAPVAPPPVDTSALRAQHVRDSLAAIEAARRAAEEARQRAAADSARAAQAAQEAMRASLTQVIHFDFDRSDLRSDAQAILDAKLPILLANPDVTIRIAGNTDERGSTEYNLALGQRRAATAKRYLTDHGVADARIETVSYGEERPVAQGQNEDAWAQNRRDEFTIIAGGDGPLKTPRM